MSVLAVCCVTVVNPSQVRDFNEFLRSAVRHQSLAMMWRYFTNYDTEIPLGEVTVDACWFSSSLRFGHAPLENGYQLPC